MNKEKLRELTEPPTCPVCDTPFFNNLNGCKGCGYTFTCDNETEIGPEERCNKQCVVCRSKYKVR